MGVPRGNGFLFARSVRVVLRLVPFGKPGECLLLACRQNLSTPAGEEAMAGAHCRTDRQLATPGGLGLEKVAERLLDQPVVEGCRSSCMPHAGTF